MAEEDDEDLEWDVEKQNTAKAGTRFVVSFAEKSDRKS